MIGPIDSIEFLMTSIPKHLAQLQYGASQYNYCLGTRSNASSLSWFNHEDSIGSSLCLAALNASLDNLPNSMLISWYLLTFALSSQANSLFL